MADSGSTAERYARALIELGREERLIERFAKDLDKLNGFLIAKKSLLLPTMSHPGFSKAERMTALNVVLKELELHPFINNFVRIVLEKGRFRLLPAMITAFNKQADTLAGRVRAKVTVAELLSPGMRAAVTDALEKATGRKVTLQERLDRDLIGGIIAEVEGRVYDASVRSRLTDMHRRLLSGQLSGQPSGQLGEA